MGCNSHRCISLFLIATLAAILSGCSCVPLNGNKWGIFNDPHPAITSATDFAAALKTEPDSEVTPAKAWWGWFSTGFKRMGISGWALTSHTATVVGTVKRSAYSTDHFLTLDVLLATASLDGVPAELPGDRYLRAEVCTTCLKIAEGERAAVGDQVRLTGRIVWDSDGDGFYEIHPIDPSGYVIVTRVSAP